MDITTAIRGGGFLIDGPRAEDVFAPEQLSEEHLMMGRAARQFVDQEVRPRLADLEAGEHATSSLLLRRAGTLGLLGGDIPQDYGGLGLSKVATTLITEAIARGGGSFAITHNVHTGIGSLPIVFFGDESLKARYLPALASGEKIAAYALTEPGAGSDARAGSTTASLTADGRSYQLNGEKQWISNAGFADVFVLYAKVDGEQMTAFLVERDTPGVNIGPEAAKMGLQGSSTCSVYLNDALVPAENVLGEIGRGHIVAFNTLNIGRWKLAAGCLGACKAILEACATYASERHQFGHAIAEFPAIRQKLAAMASQTFALESVVYRTAGLFDRTLASLDTDVGGDAAQAIGEYAVEASINKVFGSEALDFIADEGIQIHGGYGYIRGSEVERAYRDARINRIFEGTNEINRLLIPATMLRKAARGELALNEATRRAQSHMSADPSPTEEHGGNIVASEEVLLADESARLAVLKDVTLLLLGLGVEKYQEAIDEEQELLLAVADLAILTYAWESALLRAQSMRDAAGPESAGVAIDLTRLFCDWAADRAESVARAALAGLAQENALQTQLAFVRRLLGQTPADRVVLGRRTGDRVVAAGGYSLAGRVGQV